VILEHLNRKRVIKAGYRPCQGMASASPLSW